MFHSLSFTNVACVKILYAPCCVAWCGTIFLVTTLEGLTEGILLKGSSLKNQLHLTYKKHFLHVSQKHNIKDNILSSWMNIWVYSIKLVHFIVLGLTEYHKRSRLFTLTLYGRTKYRLYALSNDIIRTWDEMEENS